MGKSSWMESARADFIKIYGPQEGARIFNTVVPSVLADFRKMLEKSVPGTIVTEDYRIEHSTVVITLNGTAVISGGKKQFEITDFIIK